MGNRLTKIYTRTGDDGTTGLGNGTRVDKDSPRIEVIGDIDELNSLLGLLISTGVPDSMLKLLTGIQHTLFNLGGELSLPGQTFIRDRHVQALELALNQYNAVLPSLKEFILPGGNKAASVCHVARAVCRRTERHLIALARSELVGEDSIIYLNRLSDLLFVLARALSRETEGEEVYWKKDGLD